MNNGKICVSVCAETADELIEQIKRAEILADVIEIRFDCLKDSEFVSALEKLSASSCKKPFLATFRPQTIDADLTPVFRRSEDAKTSKRRSNAKLKRLNIWEKIIKINGIRLFDIEPDFRNWLYHNISFDLFFEDNSDTDWDRNFATQLSNRILIISEHYFDEVPNDIDNRFERLSQELKDNEDEEDELIELEYLTADVVKIAAQVHDISDSIAIWKLLEGAKKENKQIIPIAMGEAGKWTRILGLAHGAFMTYAALDEGKETASGQITAQDLIETYRVLELNIQTEIYGIVGNPVSHSLSPYIHNAAFKIQNLNAVYIPFEVKNLDEFVAKFIRPATREIELNIKGFSVTIPHKQAIIKLLDFIDETAEKIGAVNTVKVIDGKLHGYNTDAQGFIEPLRAAYGDLNNVEVAVLGSGGAARACVFALKKEKAKITIFARDIEKAKILADEFETSFQELKFRDSNFNTFDVIVNATPLGTVGEMENETPALADQIKDVHLVYDLVYNPFETRFLREAKSVNVPTVGGLAMLVSQAAAQFKIWTELDAPVEEMSRTALRKLQSR